MQINYIPFEQTGFFSKLVVDYINQSPTLQAFYNQQLTLENTPQIIQQYEAQNKCNREVLVKVLQKQANKFEICNATKTNIVKLKNNNTYTITTGHQLNLASGPLYIIYKISSVIKLCQQLNNKHAQYNFIPLFWMNTEDHDFDEINHFNLYGKTYTWQTPWQGPTGNVSTKSIHTLIDEIKQVIGNGQHSNEIKNWLENAYLNHNNLADANYALINYIFGKYGLVILNQNDSELKALVKPLIKNQLTQTNNYLSVKETSEKLTTAGYHAQAYPRKINLFHITENSRKRVINQNNQYLFDGNSTTFSEKEIFELIEQHPEQFSFNVISRPLYQQTILPNLAYIGGGGELAYWLQLKSLFKLNDTFFPALILRNSFLVIDAASQKKIEKLTFSNEDLFTDTDKLIAQFVENNTEAQLDLSNEKNTLEHLFEKVKAKALSIDTTLEKSVEGEQAKMINQFEKLEAKMLRAEKKKFETAQNQITSIKNKLFPNNSLQERHNNFIEIWSKYGLNWIDDLIENMEPLKTEFGMIQ